MISCISKAQLKTNKLLLSFGSLVVMTIEFQSLQKLCFNVFHFSAKASSFCCCCCCMINSGHSTHITTNNNNRKNREKWFVFSIRWHSMHAFIPLSQWIWIMRFECYAENVGIILNTQRKKQGKNKKIIRIYYKGCDGNHSKAAFILRYLPQYY